MIRDPSDGSVREPPTRAENAQVRTSKKSLQVDTGIRQPTRTDAQERLERSREWLKDYQEKRNAARGNISGEEHQAAGHSSDQDARPPVE